MTRLFDKFPQIGDAPARVPGLPPLGNLTYAYLLLIHGMLLLPFGITCTNVRS